jgi:hypothetical protein
VKGDISALETNVKGDISALEWVRLPCYRLLLIAAQYDFVLTLIASSTTNYSEF